MAQNLIAHLSKEFMSGDNKEVVDIITFAEAQWGLGLDLLPAQRFMLKCVSGDNILVSDDGSPITMRDYYNSNQTKVFSFDADDWKINIVNNCGVHYSGRKKVFKLQTKLTNRWIECTADHLILTSKGYKRLDELKKGDSVVISSKEPFTETSWLAKVDVLPLELREFAEKIKQEFKNSGGNFVNAPSSILAQTTDKQMLAALADWTKNEEAYQIANSDICWDNVKSIEDCGEKDVYDISVPKTHNFIVNGIVVHNCFYGMELNDHVKEIKVPDTLNEKILYNLTEKDFLKYLYEEERCNTNEVTGKNFHEFVLVLGRRGTKCRSMDDLVPTTVGSLTFRELLKRSCQEKIGIFTYDPETLKRSITYDYSIWDNGVSDCYKIETDRAFSETSSWNHPYLVWRKDKERPEWVYVKDLRKGDSIAVSNELPAFGDSLLGCHKAAILGYLIGDGGITHSVTFTTNSQEQLDDLTECIKLAFGKYHIKRKGLDPSNISYDIVKDSLRKSQDGSQKNLVKEWLSEIGLMGKDSHNKRVPKCILMASRKEVSVFLSRLFACDGHANTESKTYKSHSNPKSHIGYCSVSRELCNDVRHLLLKFGIHCTIGPTKVKCNGKDHKAWMLRIVRQDSMVLFEQEINIFTKEDTVREAVQAAKNREETKSEFDSLPIGVWNYIRKVREKRKLKNVDFIGKYGIGQNDRLRMQYTPNRRKVEQYGKNIGDQWLMNLGTSDIRWDKVKSITHVGDKKTVDLSVKGTHVIGGEILSHNSTMASCISNYELYKLVKRGDPNVFFGFPSNAEIAILNVAPTDDQAGVVFNMIQSQAMKCPYLRDRSLNQTMSYFNIQTDADMKVQGRPRASIVSIAGGCSSNSLRGRNAIIVIMDEMAFFIDKANSRFSGAEVYKALTPSMSSFGAHGKVLCLSSPYAKFGRFYERYLESFDEQDYTLMFKMPTAMANPTVPSEILRASYRRDRTSFMCEFGGEFSDRVTAWIEIEEEFRKCIVDKPVPTRGDIDTKYFMGIDLGFKNDGTSIAIVHKEGNKIVLDYANVWYSGSSDVWTQSSSIYHSCTKYKENPLLKMADIVTEVKSLTRWFPIKDGIFDQSNGYGLSELLTGAGYTQLNMTHFTDTLNNDVYELTKRLYGEQLLELYDHPVLIPELLSLEAEKKSRGKVLVEAPNREGAHDDICLVGGTKIYTRQGIKNIEDVEVGDEVLTHKGRYRKVLKVFKRDVSEDIVSLQVTKLGNMRLTGNHPVYVLRGKRKQFVKAEDLTKKDKVICTFDNSIYSGTIDLAEIVKNRSSKVNNAGLFLGDIVVEDSFISYVNGRSKRINRFLDLSNRSLYRLLGYFLAEGSFGEHGISFAFHKDEKEYHEDVKALVESLFGVSDCCERENNNAIQLNFNSRLLSEIFECLIGRKIAGQKTIPHFAMTAPFDCQEQLVKGMWRGDGSFDCKRRTFTYTTTSSEMAFQLRQLLFRLGVICGICISKRKGREIKIRGKKAKHNYDLFNVRVQSYWNVLRFAEILDFNIDDIVEKLRPTRESFIHSKEVYTSLRKISKEYYNGSVFNLEVQEDNSYVTTEGTVHNCDAFVRAVWACYNATSKKPNNISTGAGGRSGSVGSVKDGVKIKTQSQTMLEKRKSHGPHPRGLDRLRKRRGLR